MSAEETEIRAFCDGDEIAINQAFNSIYTLERPLDEWNWRFPAFSDGRVVQLGLIDGRLRGHCGGVPISFRAGGGEIPALMLRDVFSVADSTDRASNLEILAHTLRVFIHDATQRGRAVLTSGVGGSEISHLVSDSDRWIPLEGGAEALARDPRTPSPMRRLLYRAELARDWEPRLDDLWHRARDAYPLAVVRDATLALGHFAGHPRLRFHRFLVFPRFRRKPVAWVVFESGGGVCRWMDLLWDHRHPGALDMVAHLSARYCVQMGLTVEKIVLGGDRLALERLRSLGFEDDRGEEIVVEAFALNPDDTVRAIDHPLYVTELDLDRA